MPKPILSGSAARAGSRPAAPNSSAAASNVDMRRAVGMACPPRRDFRSLYQMHRRHCEGSEAISRRLCSPDGDCFVAPLLAMTAFEQKVRAAATESVLKPRHDLLAEQAQRVQHAVVRDQAAAIQFGEDAVEADLVAQLA